MSQQLSLFPDLLQPVPVTKGKPTQVQRSPVLGAYSKAAHAWMDYAAFVVERLNEVFGPRGCGWRYVHAPFEWIEGEALKPEPGSRMVMVRSMAQATLRLQLIPVHRPTRPGHRKRPRQRGGHWQDVVARGTDDFARHDRGHVRTDLRERQQPC